MIDLDAEPLDDHDGKFRDKCAVFGVWLAPEDRVAEVGGKSRDADWPAANYTYLGLHAQQHRGQESAGIAVTDGTDVVVHRAMGLVHEIFQRDVLKKLKGFAAIGHARYATQGRSTIANAQPLLISYAGGELAVGHNGNLVNAPELREELEQAGSVFQSTSDTEVFLHLIARSRSRALGERLVEAAGRVEGAWSVVLLQRDQVVAGRDPHGFRPLVLGRLGARSWVVASETCAFDLIGATYEREVAPGEVVVLNADGVRSYHLPKHPVTARCVFEHIYFARPDTTLYGLDVHAVRRRIGNILAEEHPADADVVIPVPDSGTHAALGYAQASGVPFEMGLIRSHYVGRTFIEPLQQIRQFGVRLKLSPVRGALEGKRVCVVDDSIVRGNTSARILKMIRSAGAREIHVRIASPPTIGPCHYGIDTPDKDQLIAANMSVPQVAEAIGADSLGYISIEGLKRAVGGGEGYCYGCFTGRYPVAVPRTRAGERPAGAYIDVTRLDDRPPAPTE